MSKTKKTTLPNSDGVWLVEQFSQASRLLGLLALTQFDVDIVFWRSMY
jgi:hypothetical protein